MVRGKEGSVSNPNHGTVPWLGFHQRDAVSPGRSFFVVVHFGGLIPPRGFWVSTPQEGFPLGGNFGGEGSSLNPCGQG
jgi:hypothetical protein